MLGAFDEHTIDDSDVIVPLFHDLFIKVALERGIVEVKIVLTERSMC